MAEKNRLGKGLANIFGEEIYDAIKEIEQTGVANQIEIARVRPNPYQPRKKFDQAGLEELAKSIATHGVFTPILVRETISGYELVAGERRLRAAKMNEMTEIPAIIVEFNDQQMMEISLLENIQREDLNAIEEANAYQKLIVELKYTQELLAERINKSRAHVANMLRLLKLPKDVQGFVESGQLSMGHVRPLITLEDPKKIVELAKKAINENLNVRQVEALAKTPEKPVQKESTAKNPYKYAEELMAKKLQTAVKINDKQITIKYNDSDDLNRLLEIMNCLED